MSVWDREAKFPSILLSPIPPKRGLVSNDWLASFSEGWTDSLVDTIFKYFHYSRLARWPPLSNSWALAFCAFGTASTNSASALLRPDAA